MSLTSCSRHPVKLFLFFLPFLPPLVFEKAEIMPPFALALQCHEQACQFPSFGRCCLASRWNWTRVKTWHVTSPCPPISESDCVNQVGSNPSSQALHVCELSRWLASPYHLGESSQGREVYRYLERTSDLVLATAAHILKLDRYRED